MSFPARLLATFLLVLAGAAALLILAPGPRSFGAAERDLPAAAADARAGPQRHPRIHADD